MSLFVVRLVFEYFAPNKNKSCSQPNPVIKFKSSQNETQIHLKLSRFSSVDFPPPAYYFLSRLAQGTNDSVINQLVKLVVPVAHVDDFPIAGRSTL